MVASFITREKKLRVKRYKKKVIVITLTIQELTDIFLVFSM